MKMVVARRKRDLECNIPAADQQLDSGLLERLIGTTVKGGRPKRQLTPDQRRAITARLVAGQERARARRETEARAESKASKK